MKKLLFLVLTLTLLGCTNNNGTVLWRVWYAVQVPPNYDLKITYNSDKFFDSGMHDTIYVHDSYDCRSRWFLDRSTPSREQRRWLLYKY